MKFSYRRFEVDETPTVPKGVVYRPMVSIRIIGPLDHVNVRALVDTGADETIFPVSIAEAIGAEMDEAESVSLEGIGGHMVQAVLGTVEIEIGVGKSLTRWQQRARFVPSSLDDEVPILGHVGFLQYFATLFDGKRHQMTLTPNGTFPRP